MKKYSDDLEKLSAYIDGELPLSEKNEFEQKLSVSPELKKKLQELTRAKELVSANFKRLPESPFFETRVMANLAANENIPLIRRRWVPVAALIIVTAVMMVIFKLNPGIINRLVEQQTTSLAAFYKENLKPLLYAANLSNEDIFNFAFYKELPLDNNKEQFLQIGNKPDGVQFFEIKKSSYNIAENNYERFVTALNLNENQKRHVDSILQHYAGELQAQVLVNDRNTVAINPNLWNYNKAIAADIVRFASQVNEPELKRILAVSEKYLNVPEMVKMVDEIKSNQDQNYIFLTPDTIFTSWIDVDSKELKEELRIAKEEILTANEDLRNDIRNQHQQIKRYSVVVQLDSIRARREHNRYKKENFDVYIGDNNYRVEMQGFEPPEIPIPDMDSISAHIEKVMKSVQIFTANSPRVPTKLSKRYNFQYGFGDSIKPLVIPRLDETDSAMRNSYDYYYRNNQKIDSMVSLYMPHFRFRQDSLTTYFKMYDDSSRYIYESELQNQLRQMEKEMKKFREEMQNLRQDLKKDDTKKDTKVKVKKNIEKPVEI